MLNVIDPCMGAHAPDASDPPPDRPDPVSECNRAGGSAAVLIERTLSALGPRFSPSGRFELGYTLQFPLLRLLRTQGSDWVVDRPAVERLVRTLHDVERPAIVYLFSTHFGVDAPIEEALVRDPRNLAVTPAGPMSRDRYYAIDVYPWTFASTGNDITRRRVQVVDAIVDEICRLPKRDRDKIKGVTLLGELHHLFPNFQAGMGFREKYLVSDYSPTSVAGFRAFLAARFGSVAALNQAVGADYPAFDAVDPPSKDIRTEPLKRYTEHIDSFAQGSLPISGWVRVMPTGSRKPLWVRIYRDGEFVGRASVGMSRQDVLEARPEFGTADVGWRFDLDYSALVPGVHRIDLLLEGHGESWVLMETRHVSVMDRNQTTPREVPTKALPTTVPADESLLSYVDLPAERSSYYFNPLVPLWHRFRASQVVDYLRYFDDRVRRSCLADVDTYVHQITPFTNPGWDVNKFAVDASLAPFGRAHLGVSLYGEPTYGTSFFDWYARSEHRTYGVTEFHPLRGMAPDEARRMFEHHRTSGAQFLSFFLDTLTLDGSTPVLRNQFSFDPANPGSGSDRLYDTVKTLLSE
ncbi:MAG: hypothetical protein ACKVOX_16520 [Rhizobacter sp.]